MYKQNSFITRYCLAVVVMLALLGPLAQNGRGNFVLYDNEQLTVNSLHSTGALYDTSRVFIVPDGSIEDRLDASDFSIVDMSGGVVYNLFAHNSSTVDISGGSVDWLQAHSSGAVNISGGNVNILLCPSWSIAYNSCTVDVSGGFVNYLYAWGSCAVNISGGSVNNNLRAYNSSNMDISGGSVSNFEVCNSSTVDMSSGSVNYLNASDSSSVDISGGTVGILAAQRSSVVTFYGQDFLASGGLILDGDRVLGLGMLSGEWLDGTGWVVEIYRNDATATIWAIPGPSVIPAPGALLLGGIGVGCLTWLRRRMTL